MKKEPRNRCISEFAPILANKKGLITMYQTYSTNMAENGGFEPPQLLHPNGFRNHPLQPLE